MQRAVLWIAVFELAAYQIERFAPGLALSGQVIPAIVKQLAGQLADPLNVRKLSHSREESVG